MIAIDSGELTRAVQQVFSSMLGLQLNSSNGDRPPDFPPERKVSAAVGISGEWNGAVVLECGTATACHLTGVMMGSPPPPTVDEVVKDVDKVFGVGMAAASGAAFKRKKNLVGVFLAMMAATALAIGFGWFKEQE